MENFAQNVSFFFLVHYILYITDELAAVLLAPVQLLLLLFPEFDDMVDVNNDDGIELKKLKQSHNFIVIAFNVKIILQMLDFI